MFTYIAIPYSDPDPEVRAERMRVFWRACAYLVTRGDDVLSPMMLEPMTHAFPSIATTYTAWANYSRRLIGISNRMVVVALPGWEQSTGVLAEIEYAHQQGVPVEHLSLRTLEEQLHIQEQSREAAAAFERDFVNGSYDPGFGELT